MWCSVTRFASLQGSDIKIKIIYQTRTFMQHLRCIDLTAVFIDQNENLPVKRHLAGMILSVTGKNNFTLKYEININILIIHEKYSLIMAGFQSTGYLFLLKSSNILTTTGSSGLKGKLVVKTFSWTKTWKYENVWAVFKIPFLIKCIQE